MTQPNIHIASIVSLPFEENTFIAHWDGRDDALVFDPGLEPDKIFAYLDEMSLSPAAIVLTHGHGDHIGGNAALKQRWPDCPIVIGRGDVPKLSDPVLNLSANLGAHVVSPPADVIVDEGDVYRAAGFELHVLEIPGHSIGHVVYVCKDHSPQIVFGGDVLFSGSVGRTDFPDGDAETLFAGIREKLFTLPDDTIVLPGHGPSTTIGHEKQHNPFVGEAAG